MNLSIILFNQTSLYDKCSSIHLSTMGMQYVAMNEKVTDFHNICIKCGKMCSEHPATGRFNTVILFGHECGIQTTSLKGS
jgi:hypothetical protein